MNQHVDPPQGHGDSLMSPASLTQASTDFSPLAAKARLLDDSFDRLHIHTHLFSEKNIDPRTPHRIYGRP